MAGFMIRFLISNLFISGMIGILFAAKRLLKNSLTSRMQYNLWYVMLVLLAVPFLPLRMTKEFPQLLSWLGKINPITFHTEGTIETTLNQDSSRLIYQMNDFALSVGRETPSFIGSVLCGIWLMGILVMIFLIIKSQIRLKMLKNSALPLQNREVRILYNSCLNEMRITSEIPVYSTAFLKSPIIVGLFRPGIYLPIHLISDYCAKEMRYILLHELQHFKYKDALADYLMNLAGVLYWFHPFVWYALDKMRNDREIACDTSVLKLLEEDDYEDYGTTLINFAEKLSVTPFPFAVGMSGTMKQMRQRIINISSYKKPSVWRSLKGLTAFAAISLVLLRFTPMLSTYAADQNHYPWNMTGKNISLMDLSAYFGGYEGSFVLYDQKDDTWKIYDMDHATLRTSPNSTYKIYDALFGLEEGVITPDDSSIAWDGTAYAFEEWNADQDLHSAMRSSVNWYFQNIDKRLGTSAVKNYLKKIGYGNKNINAGLSSYWMQSSLKISPAEQVELLMNLYHNHFGFTPESINAVKDSICLFSSENRSIYGKTGTGCIDGKNVNGWFVGFVSIKRDLYFFATHIQGDTNVTGNHAAEITRSILSDLNIWK